MQASQTPTSPNVHFTFPYHKTQCQRLWSLCLMYSYKVTWRYTIELPWTEWVSCTWTQNAAGYISMHSWLHSNVQLNHKYWYHISKLHRRQKTLVIKQYDVVSLSSVQMICDREMLKELTCIPPGLSSLHVTGCSLACRSLWERKRGSREGEREQSINLFNLWGQYFIYEWKAFVLNKIFCHEKMLDYAYNWQLWKENTDVSKTAKILSDCHRTNATGETKIKFHTGSEPDLRLCVPMSPYMAVNAQW
jgi:hypothetical protein